MERALLSQNEWLSFNRKCSSSPLLFPVGLQHYPPHQQSFVFVKQSDQSFQPKSISEALDFAGATVITKILDFVFLIDTIFSLIVQFILESTQNVSGILSG